MPDLTAASYDDVVEFFKKYYAPGNASLVVAGDIDPVAARAAVEKWFGDVKRGANVEPMTIPGVQLNGVQKKTMTDKVQLQRLYLAWLTPAHFAPGDAALDMVADTLTGGKNSRLYKRLVYDLQIAQDALAYQASQAPSSHFLIQATARPGHTTEELQKVIDEEIVKLQAAPPSQHDFERSLNQIESSFLQPHGACRRLRRQGRSAQRLLHRHRRRRLLQRRPRALPRAVALRHPRGRVEVPDKDARVELTVLPEGAK